ncbi:MAG: phosphatidylglycerophosphatase A [Candidatus Omnitrophota bacterium]|jgi:phosphatidylglycerophosphatase A
MPVRNSIIKIISTFFYVGYLPLIPGTFGSIAGLFLFYLLHHNAFIYAASLLALMLLGFLTCGEAEQIFQKKDARYIVIDEVIGMLLSLLFIPYDIKLVVIAFFLFRLLDTLKPYPAGKLQGLRGSIGIISDDIIAGLYTNIILQAVLRLASLRTA